LSIWLVIVIVGDGDGEKLEEINVSVFSLSLFYSFSFCVFLYFFSLFFLVLSPFSLFTCFSSLCFVFKKNPLKLLFFTSFLYYLIFFYPYSICPIFYSLFSLILSHSKTFHNLPHLSHLIFFNLIFNF